MKFKQVETKKEQDGVLKLLTDTFGDDADGYEKHVSGNNPDYEWDRVFVAVTEAGDEGPAEPGTVVSTVTLIRKSGLLYGFPIHMCSVCYVATHPEYRGKFLFSRVQQMLEQRAVGMGIDLSFVGGIPYFYKRYGFEYAITLDFNGIRGALSLPLQHDNLAVESGVSLARMPDEDLEIIGPLIKADLLQWSQFCFERPADMWRFRREHVDNEDGKKGKAGNWCRQFMRVLRGDEHVAYLQLERWRDVVTQEPYVSLKELVVLKNAPQTPEFLRAIVRAAAEHAHTHLMVGEAFGGLSTLHVGIHPRHALWAVLKDYNVDVVGLRHALYVKMLRPAHIMRQMAHIIQARMIHNHAALWPLVEAVEQADQGIHVTIDTYKEPSSHLTIKLLRHAGCVVSAMSSECTVTTSEAPEEGRGPHFHVSISPTRLVQLLLGHRSWVTVVDDEDVMGFVISGQGMSSVEVSSNAVRHAAGQGDADEPVTDPQALLLNGLMRALFTDVEGRVAFALAYDSE